MSKSEQDPRGRIELTDSPDIIRDKIKKSVTDCTSNITYEPDNRPGVSNLVDIHAALTGLLPKDIMEDPQVMIMDTVQYKEMVSEVVIEGLRPIREEVERLARDEGYVLGVLEEGGSRAKQMASENFRSVKELIGLL